jgi:ubiquinol-cytochrome c reductase iron-sulfur subunit
MSDRALPRRPRNRRAHRAAVVAFAVAAAGGAAAAVSDLFGVDTDPSLSGIGLAVALFGTGFGLVSWAKYVGFDDQVVEARQPLTLTDEDRAALREHLDEAGEEVGRRGLLTGLFALSLGMLAVGLVGPIGSLDSQARGDRSRTRWRSGARLATSDGQPVRADVERYDQMVTVFPEDALTADDSQVVLIRVRPELLNERTVAAGAVDGWVAYSKICTHAGCSVGLFGIDSRPPIELRELVCPCHQSVFDPLDRARPVGGPATRPLPQLPLGVDADGFLVALADFDQPVGPIAWDEG